MRVRDFHAVDLDEDEVVQFLRLHGSIELRDDLTDSGCLACPWCTGDVDARAGTVSDGRLQMSVDRRKLILSTWQCGWHGRHVEVVAGELKRGGHIVCR